MSSEEYFETYMASREQIGAKIGMDANSVLHVAQRMTKIIRKNVKNMPKQPNECHVGHPI